MTVGTGSGAKQDARRRNPALEWTLAILLSVAGVLVALELGLRLTMGQVGRLYDIVHPSGDGRNYELMPGSSTLYSGFWDPRDKPIEWTVNSDGLRSDRAVPPRSGRYRIATYGDSETFGWAVRLEDTFQRLIEATDPDVEVLNLGIPGYNIENIVDYMSLTLDRYLPDRVVYLFHKNDMDRALTLSPLLSKSYVYNAARYAVVLVRSDGRKAHRRTAEGYRFLMGQLERMAALCRERDIPLTIGVLQWEFEKAFAPVMAVAQKADDDATGSVRPGGMNVMDSRNPQRDAGASAAAILPHPARATPDRPGPAHRRFMSTCSISTTSGTTCPSAIITLPKPPIWRWPAASAARYPAASTANARHATGNVTTEDDHLRRRPTDRAISGNREVSIGNRTIRLRRLRGA